MSRSRWLAASALSLALVVAPVARAGKPQPPPPPRMVGAVWAALSGCTNVVAVDDAGRVLIAQCYGTGFLVAAQLPGTPVSLHMQDYGTSVLYVGLASGDVYRCDTRSAVPWPFEFMGNVFASGPSARVPAFPDVAPLEDARPILTGEGAPDTDDVGAPAVK